MSIRRLVPLFVLVTMALTMAFAAVPAQAGGYCTTWHTVQRGENLYRISVRYNVPMATIASLSGLTNWNLLYAGQQLCISGVNNNPNPNPGGTLYTVQPGDRLSRIAQRYGVSMWVLAQVNNIWNVNFIYVGQVLRIPDVTIQ